MGFSRQEYWSGLPFPSPGIFQTQGLNPGLLHCRLTRLTHARIFQTCAVHLGFSPWNSVVTVFAPRRCCASFRPGLRMISRLEGHEWQRPGWSSSSASSLGRGRRTLEKTEMGRKTSQSQRGEQGGERMVTDCGSCQQTSDSLHCSEERRQVFPNPGAPTRLRKPRPSAHRRPTLLQNQWDTLGNRPSFWRHLCKSCLSPWWMLESQHWVTQSRLLFTAKLISEMSFSDGCGPGAKSQCLLPPAAAGLAEHERRGTPRALKSTEVGRAGHGGKLWSQQSYRGHSSLPPCFPFLHPFPPSQLAASHFPGDRATEEKPSRDTRGQPTAPAIEVCSPPQPPPSLKQTQERIPYISKD